MSERRKNVYVGPPRPFNLPLMPNSILADAPETVFPPLRQLFARHENFRKLFVPVADLAKARAALKLPGSSLSGIAREIGHASQAAKQQ